MNKFILLHYFVGKTRLLVNPITGICIVEDVCPLMVMIFNMNTSPMDSVEFGICVAENFDDIVAKLRKVGCEVVQ